MKRATLSGPPRAITKALEFRSRGKLAEAESCLRQFLRETRAFPPALHLLGIVRHERGDNVEARSLIERALALAPRDADAWRNLGNVCNESGDTERAEACFRQALDLHPMDIAARGTLALLLEDSGRHEEAIAELRVLLMFAPGEDGAMQILARLLRKTRRHEEEVSVARELLRRSPSDDALKRALSRSYFLWFDAVDRDPEKARRVLAEWIAQDPEDPVARHMLAAQQGDDLPPRAADAYVERHFDEFAETFDSVLGSLKYRGPELVHEALRRSDPEPRGAHVSADLGCGTGLCGPLVRPWVRSQVGVDLSQKMLDLARQRGGYDELVHQEVTAFVEARPATFDLILCTETLPYFGDVTALFAGVAAALRPGGRFITTAELLDRDDLDFSLHAAGRFAHRAGYLETSLKQAGLALEHSETADVREEYGRMVRGLVLTARPRAPG
jgi:predicted TPR repeat methyltransferase